MRKLIRFLVSFLFILLFLINVNLGDSFASMPMPPNDQLLLGQNHYYSVFFRGNGEAVVSFKAQFTNNSEYPVSNLTYIFPKKTDIDNLVVYQVDNWTTYPCYQIDYRQVPLGIDKETNDKILPLTVTPEPVLENIVPDSNPKRMPCLDQQYYPRNKYLKADYEIDGNTLTIFLPNEVQATESVSFFLSYRTFSYVEKGGLDVFKYAFATLKSFQTVDSIQVGISTEQDYVLKDAKGGVSYNTDSSKAFATPPAIGGTTDSNYTEYESYFNQIGYGTIYKYSSHLAPMETYIVKGAYADSIWKLYAVKLVVSLIIVLLVIITVIAVIKKVFMNSSFKVKPEEKTTLGLWQQFTDRQRILVSSVGLSLLGTTLSVVYSVLLYFFMTAIMPNLAYRYDYEMVFMLLIIVFSFAVYAALLFLPALMVSLRRSVTWGIVTFSLSVIWLFIYLALFLLLVFLMGNRNGRSYPVPLMGTESVENLQE